ncbi:glycosyltransferase [Paradesulfitobacterium aromaticivorans]
MSKLCLLANAASSHTEKWASELGRRGWDVHVVSFLPARIPHATVHVVPGFIGGKLDVILRRNWVVDEVKRLKPDIIHAHYATSFGFLGALAKEHPYVISAWGSDIFFFPRHSFVHSLFLKWTLKQADVLCSTSRIMAQEMQRYTESGRTVEVIPFGVDIERFKPPAEERQDSLQPLIFGVAKYFQPVYGLDVLFKAFAQIERQTPGRARLRLAGDGPEKARLQRLALKLGIARKIEWLGAIPSKDVAELYQSLDVVVVPSRQESFGVTAVEGSACGRPIIASRVGGLPEVVTDKETGLLIPPGDVQELAAAMEYMIDHPEERKRMGEAGRSFVLEHYDWQENVTEMERVYRGVLGVSSQ